MMVQSFDTVDAPAEEHEIGAASAVLLNLLAHSIVVHIQGCELAQENPDHLPARCKIENIVNPADVERMLYGEGKWRRSSEEV